MLKEGSIKIKFVMADIMNDDRASDTPSRKDQDKSIELLHVVTLEYNLQCDPFKFSGYRNIKRKS